MPYRLIHIDFGMTNVMNAACTVARPSGESLRGGCCHWGDVLHAWVRLEIK